VQTPTTFVEFEVFTPVTTKSTIFWDVTPALVDLLLRLFFDSEDGGSFETLVNFYQPTPRCNPEDHTNLQDSLTIFRVILAQGSVV
jgi:hypothetical protein